MSICYNTGYQIIDRPRPRNESGSLTLSTNYGGVATVSVPGVYACRRSLTLGVNPTSSLEFVCHYADVFVQRRANVPSQFAGSHDLVLRRPVGYHGLRLKL